MLAKYLNSNKVSTSTEVIRKLKSIKFALPAWSVYCMLFAFFLLFIFNQLKNIFIFIKNNCENICTIKIFDLSL